ncbi:MAG TPA: ferritin-like domain-containing protein [Candidatus Baltobacteraceae bacterium]|nr:ferritin-like domain-containing protein [Candidatus Baltobacteraceae bacterium]
MSTTQTFLTDVKELRRRARENMDRGAITSSYELDPKQVVDVLNASLATEIVCVLRYKRHYFSAKGLNKDAVAAEFLQHATEEQGHADRIAERITQLGGDPDLNPATLTTRSHSEYNEGTDLISMIKENLVAERIAIESYTEIIRFLGDKDVTSRRLIEVILGNEEEHANDMLDLIEKVSEKGGNGKGSEK